jgi:general secretion pathway protein F
MEGEPHEHSYIYRAVDAAGTLQVGELSAFSRSVALEALSRRGLIPVELLDRRGGRSIAGFPKRLFAAPRIRLHSRSQLSSRELLALTQSLASLLTAGITIDRALQISASLASRPSSRALTESLLKAIRSGRTLSDAFAASGQRMPPYLTSMVEAGEAGGTLPGALTQLTDLMRSQIEVRERIRSALVYPSLLVGVVLFTLIMLLVFVLPRFELLFSESEAPLPLSTRAVLSVGRFVADYWWSLLILGALTATAFTGWLRSPPGRRQFAHWLLRSKITLGLPGALDTARLLRTVSTLCKSGLPLPSSLRVARGTLTNLSLHAALSAVTREVQAGETFSVALARAAVFPQVAVQLSRVGEETGRLDELLLSAAAVLEEESHLKLERLLTLIVPLLTITMGVIVAGLIGSVLIGLLSINDLAF